jgi:hypothetical protein
MPGVTDAGDGVYARHGRSYKMYQNLTSGEFQNQFEIFISSCNTGSETSFQTMIYATTG